MARPTRLTQQLVEQAVELWKRGYMMEEIHTVLDIPRRTWYGWLQRGRDGKQPYVALVDAFEQARVQRRIELLRKVEAAADKHWQAAAWILEREWPERYARPELRLKYVDEPVDIVDDSELRVTY